MTEQLDRYARGAGGAAFIVVWATLGLEIALFALVGAVVAAALPWLRGILVRTRRTPQPRRGRRRGNLPLVPDEPSLVLTVADL